MTTKSPAAVVTGANGYLGARICRTLESRGWRVIKLTGSQAQVPGEIVHYDLARPVTPEVSEALQVADVLIHTAYNLTLTGADDIWQVNVEGTRRLLEAAKKAGSGRAIVLSSMSAFTGTSQLYGRAKLDIEAMTVDFGGCAVRPGLVHGKEAGGMAGSLRKLGALPVVPVIAGGAGVYTVAEEDLMETVVALASAKDLVPGTISVAHPEKVTLVALISTFSAQSNRHPRFISVPWRLVYWGLKSGEFMRLPLPFRADSLLGLVCTAPGLVGQEQFTHLGVTLRPFKAEPAV
jgi:nucleoside-diphosphate-sugar epimerase